MSSEINSGVHNNLFQNLTTAVVAAATKKDEFSVQENPHHHVNTLANYTNMTTLGKKLVFLACKCIFTLYCCHCAVGLYLSENVEAVYQLTWPALKDNNE